MKNRHKLRAIPDSLFRGRLRPHRTSIGAGDGVAHIPAWLQTSRPNSSEATSNTARTIVVIPFENLGAGDDAGFADGVTADIAEKVVNALSVTIGANERAALRRPGSNDPEARDAAAPTT